MTEKKEELEKLIKEWVEYFKKEKCYKYGIYADKNFVRAILKLFEKNGT
jgi:hypothetical protein